jgi:hypothetical protein
VNQRPHWASNVRWRDGLFVDENCTAIDSASHVDFLPSETDMNRILRCEQAAQKTFDWALQRLLESQQQRRKAQAPVSVQVSSDQ